MNFLLHNSYLLNIIINISLFAFLGYSTFLLFKINEISFCQQSYFGVSAYISGTLTVFYGFNLIIAVIASALITTVLSLPISFALLYVNEVFFSLSTIILGFLILALFNNIHFEQTLDGIEQSINGADGFPGIRYLLDNGIDNQMFLGIILFFLFISYAIIFTLFHGKLGITIKMIADDKLRAATLGIRVKLYQMLVLTAANFIAALGGALFAHFTTYIEPDMFGLMLGVHSLAYGIIGGLGTTLGPIVGICLDIGLLESLSFTSSYRMIIFGILLVLILKFKPRGILDEHTMSMIRAKLW